MRSRTAWTTGLAAATLTAAAVTAAPADAVSGPQATDASAASTASLNVGGQEGCSGTLVAPQWLLTAASCFADTPSQGYHVQAGAPKLKTTATFAGGVQQQVTEVVPRSDRDVVMARLAAPVTGITPATVATTAPATGDEVQAVGFGRTSSEWVPGQAHTAPFTVGAVGGTTINLAAASGGGAICKGDTGGPALRTVDGRAQVVAVHSLSWQGGCLGTDASETRTGAVDARVDDIAGWVGQISYSTTFAKAPWVNAQQMTAGYYTGGSAAGTRHMDLVVRWNDGEVTLYQGGDNNDPAHPFSAEYQLAKPKSIWAKALNISRANFNGGATDGLVVRWVDGEMTQYTTVDAKGFHGEKQLAKPKTPVWQNDARLMTAGKFTTGGKSDDLMVVWKDGNVSAFTDLAANGLNKQTEIVKPNTTTWPYADQLTTGQFTGKATDDVLVRWKDGETTIYPGMTTSRLPAEDRIALPKSRWAQATVVAAGAFGDNNVSDDVLVRWSDGHLSLFTGVDAKGTHDETVLTPKQ
ncbi:MULTISPECIES: S1 family peptidase [Streptomycetaceae]|nr:MULTISPECIES: S1 family peptidase [Streptomycetaceae]MYS57617.1 trypsin-like serine protease [Streptomyces sp. SID5468]CCB73217.1 putative secreted esterase [Streptantibioticus cattleyicolor NRRL 8057 = DSM 46488]